jgi:CheY-like chemotaxis protein
LANRTKDEFIAIVSHELRSPLNAIVGWTKLLKIRKFDQTTASRALETIERNTQAQLQLIEDLLDISRMIRGNLRLTVSPVNLATLVETTVNSFHFAAQEKKQQLEINIDTSSCKVVGDINRLQQIVSNLLFNAIKFTPTAGRIEISLDTVSSQHKQSISKKQELTNKTYAKIQVTDTGKGIKPDFLPYVFERFRQADNSTTRAKDGLGLGLAIVHHLVGLHGGNITAFSAGEGLGATFTVILPLLGDEGDKGNEGNEENEGNEGDKSSFSDSNCLSGVKVLIVDDEPDTREYIRIALSQFGAVVMATASAKEALAVLNQLQPNILVSDIGMPEEDGYMLLEMVRELTQYRQIPAIALTAYAKQEDRNRSFRAGFQLHITKPVEPVGLVTAIISLIGR